MVLTASRKPGPLKSLESIRFPSLPIKKSYVLEDGPVNGLHGLEAASRGLDVRLPDVQMIYVDALALGGVGKGSELAYRRALHAPGSVRNLHVLCFWNTNIGKYRIIAPNLTSQSVEMRMLLSLTVEEEQECRFCSYFGL